MVNSLIHQSSKQQQRIAQALFYKNKMLSYRRETALQGALGLAKSGRMGLGYDILLTL